MWIQSVAARLQIVGFAGIVELNVALVCTGGDQGEGASCEGLSH